MSVNRKVKKQILHDALLDALANVIAVLEPYVQSGKVPKEPVTEARLRDDGGFIHKHYHRRDYSVLCARLAEKWQTLPQIQKAVQEFINDTDIQKDFGITGFGNLHNYVTNQIVHQFIYRILHLTRRWPPSRAAIEKSFFEFEDYLLGATLSCEAVVPLENFKCESKKLVFERNVIIRELSNPEKEHFLSIALSGWSLQSAMEMMRHTFAATFKFIWQKGATQPHHRDLIEKLLAALRLFKTGGVGANVAYKRELKWQPGHIVGGAERHIFTLPVQGSVYTLNSQEAKTLLTFWKWLYQQPPSNSAEVAIRWFNHGYQDWIPEDRIISFVTAFESLFLRKNEPKKKNLVSRLSKLLTNGATRNRVEQDVGDIWDLRSNVVHAEPYQPTEATRLVGIAECYLRESIKRYIELERSLIPHTHRDILRWLDSPNVDPNKLKLFPHWQAI